MRIGVISTIKYLPWGGSEELWSRTAKLALKRGLEVNACFIRPQVDHPEWKDLEQAGAQLFYPSSEFSFGTRLASRAGALSYRIGEHVREQARLAPLKAFFATKPDVLLINEGGGILEHSFFEMLVKTMPRLPYVALFHNNFEQVPADSWRADLVRFFSNAEAVLYVAEATLRATERNLATDFANARIVRNPVNIESIDKEPWPQQPLTHLACVGALDVMRKGQDLLLEALSTRGWKARDWRLGIYGSGEHKKYLQELTSYYGLADRVEIHDEVRDVRAIWRDNHALVLRTRIGRAPLVIVEAMFCGRPVIATPVGGIREWIQDGRNGFLSEAVTSDAVSAALERSWERRQEWPHMGARGHEDAIRMYDPAPEESLLSILTEAAKPADVQLARAAAL